MNKKSTLSLGDNLETALKLKIFKERSAMTSRCPQGSSFLSDNGKKNLKNKVVFQKKDYTDNLSEEEKLALKRKLDERKRRKLKRKKSIIVISWLKNRYPKCFGGNEILPLKIGIREDISADLPSDAPVSKCGIRNALSFYTRCYPYWKALVNHDYRYDLQGNPVELISKKHLEDAEAKLLVFLSNRTVSKKKKNVVSF